jgi:hypothetical protein
VRTSRGAETKAVHSSLGIYKLQKLGLCKNRFFKSFHVIRRQAKAKNIPPANRPPLSTLKRPVVAALANWSWRNAFDGLYKTTINLIASVVSFNHQEIPLKLSLKFSDQYLAQTHAYLFVSFPARLPKPYLQAGSSFFFFAPRLSESLLTTFSCFIPSRTRQVRQSPDLCPVEALHRVQG